MYMWSLSWTLGRVRCPLGNNHQRWIANLWPVLCVLVPWLAVCWCTLFCKYARIAGTCQRGEQLQSLLSPSTSAGLGKLMDSPPFRLSSEEPTPEAELLKVGPVSPLSHVCYWKVLLRFSPFFCFYTSLAGFGKLLKRASSSLSSAEVQPPKRGCACRCLDILALFHSHTTIVTTTSQQLHRTMVSSLLSYKLDLEILEAHANPSKEPACISKKGIHGNTQ